MGVSSSTTDDTLRRNALDLMLDDEDDDVLVGVPSSWMRPPGLRND